MDQPTSLTDEQVRGVCGYGSGQKACSYLIGAESGMCCAKGSAFESAITQRREARTMRAMGDNCFGPPDFIPKPASQQSPSAHPAKN